jgi:hypothetical protein
MSSKHKPTMAWHPKTGECQTFNHPDEVPASWLDTHPDNVTDKPAADTKNADALSMSRDEIVKALTDFEIPFKARAKDEALYALLEKALRDHFATEKVDVPADADVPALLSLVSPKSE